MRVLVVEDDHRIASCSATSIANWRAPVSADRAD